MRANTKIIKSISIFFGLIATVSLISGANALAQCGCMGGASVGGLTPVGGASNVGILREGNIRAIYLSTFSEGEQYFNRDSRAPKGTVKRFRAAYSTLLLGYGLSEDFTIDAELGYYFNKKQDFETYSLSGDGFSHVTIYGKYNVISKRAKEFEWSIGAGVKAPLDFGDENLPQNVRSSNGAYGFTLLSFLHKGFKSDGVHLVMINRADYHSENNSEFNAGENFINSFIVTKSIFSSLTAMLELRSDVKLKDSYFGKRYKDSGWNNVILSPQVNYSIDEFNFSVFCDIPAYRYYNGTQLTSSYTIGAAATWQSHLTDEIE